MFGSPDPIMSPAWSPDGRSIAYVSFHSGLSAVYVQTLATGRAGAGLGQVRHQRRARRSRRTASQLALALSRRDGNVDVYVLTLGAAGPQARYRRSSRSIPSRPGRRTGARSTSRRIAPARRRCTSVGTRARRARAPRDLRGQLQRAPAPVAGRAPACGRHARPRGLPDRHRRRQAGRTAGAERRPARRVALDSRRTAPTSCTPAASAGATRSRSSRATAGSSSRLRRARASCARPPGRRS